MQIDHRGPEEALEKAYCSIVQNVGVDGVRYESFDFHAECRHMKWDRLNILIDRLAHEQVTDYMIYNIMNRFIY